MENKTLKTLEVEVTYKIGLHNIELPAQVHDALVGLYEMDITELDADGTQMEQTATDWLVRNIRQRDAYDIAIEVTEVESGENQ